MNYREPRLLKFAKDIDCCVLCGSRNRGDVVGAHSNHISDGKGMGTKAHDLVAAVCPTCHDSIDGRNNAWDPLYRDLAFYKGVYKFMLFLLQTGRLVVGKEPYND
jgi:hypothetical protein